VHYLFVCVCVCVQFGKLAYCLYYNLLTCCKPQSMLNSDGFKVHVFKIRCFRHGHICNTQGHARILSQSTVAGNNLCVPRPLKVKCSGIRMAEGQQVRKRVLSTLQTLFPRGSTLQLALSVPVSVMSLVYTVYIFIFPLPAT
jgi:hypothetical protein